MINFDLFIQTGYSLNGSLIDIDHLVKKAKLNGFQTLGIADHNNMYGAIKFYEACHKEGIKPIIGLSTSLLIGDNEQIPILLYAMNYQGYLNLIQIASHLRIENKVIDINVLKTFEAGIKTVFITSYGSFPRLISEDKITEAISLFHYLSTQLDHPFLGLETTDFTVEMNVAPRLSEIGDTIIIHPVMIENSEDLYASKVLRTILNEQHTLDNGLFMSDDTKLYFRSSLELTDLYKMYPEAVKNTDKFISEINLTIDFDQRYIPVYPTKNGYLAVDYLRALSIKGLEKRLASKKKLKLSKKEYLLRLDYELKIIHEMAYDDYFLIVWDFVLFAKKRNILVGPGRGSAAGSLVAYVLGIVDIDPLDFDLYFERFLNPERITMPDIDMDFPDNKRDEVIQYVVNKYGKDHVTSIITFGTFQGKSALRDSAKVLGISELVISEITSYIAETDNSIASFEELHPQQYLNLMNNPEIKNLFEVSKKLVGLPRHTSTHAAGIIITDKPITEYTAIQPGLQSMYQTQYEASDLEKLGLLKIDFLGLRNLSTIQNVLDLIKSNTGEEIDIYKIDLEDHKTFELLQDVSTLGVFQLESSGMMSLLRKMQIKSFEEISTCIALFRPGPMESIPLYLQRRSKSEPVSYLAEELIPILESTEGIIIYQEQIMKIANVFAGYSLGEADVLRRAVSKKKESILIEERKKFIRKCKENNHDETTSNLIYDYIVKFANYGFNKSHSVVYSLVAYWMAYLKANYPAYFMSTLLDASIGSSKATSGYIKECRKLNIKILPPSINLSRKYYKRSGNDLIYPLLGIKNIGGIVADKLEENFNNQPYSNFIDFMRRAKDINVRVVESMIMTGMFDEFHQTKQTLIENLKQVSAYASLTQLSDSETFVYREYQEYDYPTLQAAEKDLIGFNLRYHPMNQYLKEIEKYRLFTVSDILESINEYVEFIGYLDKIKIIKTKNHDEMAFLSFEDPFSAVEAILFPKDYQFISKKLQLHQIYRITGKLDSRNNQMQVVIKSMRIWEGK